MSEVFRTSAQHKKSRIEKGHLMVDHVLMMISIPKYAVSQVVGYITSRAKVPFIWRACMERGSATSWASTSGLYRQ